MTRIRPRPERTSSTRRTRSSSSRPSVAKSLMKVARLTSLIVALRPWAPGHRLDHEVVVVLARAGAVVRPDCGRAAPRRVERRTSRTAPARATSSNELRDRVDAEREAVDPVAHRDLVRLGREAHVGGALAGAEHQQVVEDAVGVALLPVGRRPPRRRPRVGEPVDALRAQRRVHVLARHEARGRSGSRRACWPVSRCSTSASSSCGVVIFFIRISMSPRRSWLLPSVCSSSTSWRRGLPPELLLVLGARVAEAAQAERAQLGRVLRVVRAPHRARRLELPEAVPAGDEVARGHEARLDDNSCGIKAVADH